MPKTPTAVRLHIPAVAITTLFTGSTVLGGVLFDEQTTTRFPNPGPTEWTNQLTIGDIEGDGDLDIIFANGGNFSTPGANLMQRVYINDGSGNFTDESVARLNFSGLCRGVEMGDIDDDGDLDVLFVQDFNRRPQLFKNTAGVFSNVTIAQLPNISMSSSRGQFGDIDNDGDLDIYITDGGASNRFGCGQYRIFVNDGAGFFTDDTAARHPLGNVCQNMDCIFGDIDNDFDLDVKTGSTGTNNSRAYVNDGTGVYSQWIFVPSDSTCYSYDFGDIDGDGDLDMVGVNANTGSTDLLGENINVASGRYSNVSTQLSPNPNQDDNDSKFFDYDMDGDLDLIIARLGSGGEKIYDNDGDGNFTLTSGVIDVVTDSSLDIMVADLTGNGSWDIVTAQGESGSFLNRIYIGSGPADNLAPRIIDTEQLECTEDVDGPYVARALILDDMSSDRNFFDKGIELHYTVNGGSEQMVAMKHSGGQVYRGELPGQPAGSAIEYWVEATDFNDNVGVGTPKNFTVAAVGDIDCSGGVDTVDLLDLLANWGPCADPCPPSCAGDLDGDCEVSTTDLLALLANWG